MALFATTTTTSDSWNNCGTDGYSPCTVSTSSWESSSTPLSTTIESSTAWASASASASESEAPHPEPHPMTSSVGYILIGVAITIVVILVGAGIFYWRRRRRAAAAAAAAPPPDPAFPPIEKNESDAEKGYADVRLDTAVSELDPGPGGMGKVFIAELDGSSMVGGCMELDSSPVMAVSPIAGVKSNLFISGTVTNASTRNSRFAPSTYSVAGTTTSERGNNGFSGAGTGTSASAGAGVGTSVSNNNNNNNNTFVAELEAPNEVDNKSIELEGNAAPQITEVEIPSSILFTVKKSSSGEN